jgi:hypothetical protein
MAWSNRNGPFLGDGFRIRVIHCRWSFESAEHARELLETAFGSAGVDAAERMKHLRLEYSVAIYHRSAPGFAFASSQADAAAEAAAAEVGVGLVPSAAR